MIRDASGVVISALPQACQTSFPAPLSSVRMPKSTGFRQETVTLAKRISTGRKLHGVSLNGHCQTPPFSGALARMATATEPLGGRRASLLFPMSHCRRAVASDGRVLPAPGPHLSDRAVGCVRRSVGQPYHVAAITSPGMSSSLSLLPYTNGTVVAVAKAAPNGSSMARTTPGSSCCCGGRHERGCVFDCRGDTVGTISESLAAVPTALQNA